MAMAENMAGQKASGLAALLDAFDRACADRFVDTAEQEDIRNRIIDLYCMDELDALARKFRNQLDRIPLSAPNAPLRQCRDDVLGLIDQWEAEREEKVKSLETWRSQGSVATAA